MNKDTKIKQLVAAWPDGTVLTTRSLLQRGFSRSLIQKYHRSGWIKLLHKGAFFRPSERYRRPTLQGALFGLLKDEEKLSIHVGGLSALEHFGSAHFIQSGKRPTVWMFANPREKLPAWFQAVDWGVKISFHPKALFSTQEGIDTTEWNGFEVRMSSRERAALELLSLIPAAHSLDHAGLVIEKLHTLRPNLLQHLLEDCLSIKAKRLLIAIADSAKLSWLKRIKLDRVDLGTGPISLKKGAKLHPEYLISLPESVLETDMEVHA